MRLTVESFVLPRMAKRLNADVLVYPADVGPLDDRGVPFIVFARNPYVIPPGDVRRVGPWRVRARAGVQRVLLRLAARNARFLVTFTDTMREAARRTLGLSIDRIRVLRPGADHLRDAAPLELPRPFVLSVGTPYPHKNLGRLLEAWGLLKSDGFGYDLVVVGASPRQLRPYASAPLEELSVVATGPLPSHEVARYYASARAFVLPTLLESYGHPVAEALAAGLPVACSDLPVLHEVAQESAVFFDPWRPDAIARGIREVSLQPRPLQPRFKAQSWTECAAAFCHLVEEASQ